MFGVYIHIPFCHSRCVYCDFVSTTLGREWQQRYVGALLREMRQRREELGVSRARTIYIGGGTPSQLSADVLMQLMEGIQRNFTWDADCEFTLEANPDDVTPHFVQLLADTPVNRVSMGVQSTDDNVLRFLRRRHTVEQALRAIESLQQAGLANISADLIYGLPHQSLDMFCQDVGVLLATGIPHLSAYALQYEEGTQLYAMQQRGEVPPEDEEHSLRCYEALMDMTHSTGLHHYEISNFARTGMHSRHNSSYWQGLPYIGLGAGAHSYDGQCTRRANTSDVKVYINGKNETEVEVLSRTELYDERVMLSLRTREGLDLEQLQRDFGLAMRQHCERMAMPHVERGMLQRKGEHLVLARKALFVSDDIITHLLAP